MTEKEFFRKVTNSKEDVIGKILDILKKNHLPFCVVGGLAVNAYVEPVVTLDLDMVIASEKIPKFLGLLGDSFSIKRFPNSVNIKKKTSDVRFQLQRDPRYFPFVREAVVKNVLGYKMPVAKMEDIFQGKIWSATDPSRRASKRQKDLADILRLIEKKKGLARLLPPSLKKDLELRWRG